MLGGNNDRLKTNGHSNSRYGVEDDALPIAGVANVYGSISPSRDGKLRLFNVLKRIINNDKIGLGQLSNELASTS